MKKAVKILKKIGKTINIVLPLVPLVKSMLEKIKPIWKEDKEEE